jgi:hypothetical protein
MDTSINSTALGPSSDNGRGCRICPGRFLMAGCGSTVTCAATAGASAAGPTVDIVAGGAVCALLGYPVVGMVVLRPDVVLKVAVYVAITGGRCSVSVCGRMAIRGVAVEVLVLPLLLPLLDRRAHPCLLVGGWLLLSLPAVRCGLCLWPVVRTEYLFCELCESMNGVDDARRTTSVRDVLLGGEISSRVGWRSENALT